MLHRSLVIGEPYVPVLLKPTESDSYFMSVNLLLVPGSAKEIIIRAKSEFVLLSIAQFV